MVVLLGFRAAEMMAAERDGGKAALKAGSTVV